MSVTTSDDEAPLNRPVSEKRAGGHSLQVAEPGIPVRRAAARLPLDTTSYPGPPAWDEGRPGAAERVGPQAVDAPEPSANPPLRPFLGWAALGTAGIAAVELAGTRLGNLPLQGQASWLFQIPLAAKTPLQLLAWAGIVAVGVSWLGLGSLVRRGNLGTARLLVLLALWSALLVVGPPLFSNDVYSYAAQGRLAALGLDPFRTGVASLPPGPIEGSVNPFWLYTPAPYGPLFIALAKVAMVAAGPSAILAAMLLRGVELVGVGLSAWALPRIARSLGVDPARALWLAVLSPLALVSFVASGHNDALMVGLLLVSLALALEDHPLFAVVVAALGAAVKVPALAGVVFVTLAWARSRPPGWPRVAAIGAGAATAAATLAAVTIASGLGWGWLDPATLLTPTDSTIVAAPVTALGFGLHHLLGSRISLSTARSVFEVLGAAVGLVAGLALTTRVNRHNLPTALAAVLFVAVLASPVVWPWYLTWGLAVAAATRFQRSRLLALVAGAGALLVGVNGGPAVHPVAWWAVVAVVALLGAWGLSQGRWRAALAPSAAPPAGLGATPRATGGPGVEDARSGDGGSQHGPGSRPTSSDPSGAVDADRPAEPEPALTLSRSGSSR